MKPPLTLVVCLGALIAGSSACSRDVEGVKREYVARGDRFVAERRVDAAIIEYRNAVQQDPRFGEAYRKLFSAYLSRGEVLEAARAAVTAAELMPDAPDAQIEAGGAMLVLGKFAEAKKYADAALAKDADNVRARVLLGNAIAGLKDIASAIKEFEEAIRLDPQQSGVYSGLAALKASLGDRETAERIFKQAIRADEGSASARLALAQFYWTGNRVEDAERLLTEAHELGPRDTQVNLTLAVFYLATRRPEAAESYLQAAVETGKDPRLTLMLADYYIGRKRPADALALLQPLTTDSRLGAMANLRLARIAQAENRSDEAIALVDRAVALQPKNSLALAAKADLLRQRNNLGEAAKVAEAAVAANPSSIEAQFERGRVLQASGSFEGAEAAFNEVLRLNPHATAARVELARLRVLASSTDAVSVATDATKSDPTNLDARIMLVRALLQQRDLAKARAVVDELLVAFPTSAAVHAQRGALFSAAKDIAGARASFARALELDSVQIDALGGLTALDLAAGRSNEALARLDEALLRAPTSTALSLLTANALASIKNYSRAEALLVKTVESNPSSLAVYALLGRLYLAQKRLDAARAEFIKMAEHQERPIAALTVVGTIEMQQGDNAKAQLTFERALTFDPKAGVAANNLAWLYLEGNGSVDLALHLAKVANESLPNTAEVLDTLGWAYFKKDDVPAAIAALSRSLELDPRNPTTVYHLALSYEKGGKREEARQALTRYLQMDSELRAQCRSPAPSAGTPKLDPTAWRAPRLR